MPTPLSASRYRVSGRCVARTVSATHNRNKSRPALSQRRARAPTLAAHQNSTHQSLLGGVQLLPGPPGAVLSLPWATKRNTLSEQITVKTCSLPLNHNNPTQDDTHDHLLHRSLGQRRATGARPEPAGAHLVRAEKKEEAKSWQQRPFCNSTRHFSRECRTSL
jgi:hypothetical protein